MSEPEKPSLTRRIVRRSLMISATVTAFAATGAAVTLGSNFLEARANATALPDAAEPTPVAVQPITLKEGYVRQRRFIGQVEPARQIDMSFELAGRMVERTVDEGDMVAAGQVVARLDIDLLKAEAEQLDAARAALLAQLDFAKRQLERAEKLRKQGFSSVEREDQARATRDELQNRIIETDAARAAIDIRLEKSVLTAPFDGQVGDLAADPGTTLSPGQPVLTLIENTAPEVRVGLPLDLDPNALATAEVHVGQERFPARLLQLRPDIDAQTRTRTALFALEATGPLTFGRTAALVLPENVEARGAWVPMEALKEGEGGVWTVLVVDKGTIRTAAVEVLHAETARAYVRGSFEDGALLVNKGAHRVVPGQTVRVLTAGG